MTLMTREGSEANLQATLLVACKLSHNEALESMFLQRRILA